MRSKKTETGRGSWRRLSANVRFVLAVVLAVATVLGTEGGTAGFAETRSAEEDALKASFVFRFAQFVAWPAGALVSPSMNFCAMSRDSFRAALERVVSTRTVHGRPVTVVEVRAGEGVEDCHLLFLDESATDELRSLRETLAGRPTLTIGEEPDFAQIGGMIALVEQGRRLGFVINQEALEEQGLRPAAQLLRLATSADGGTPGPASGGQ